MENRENPIFGRKVFFLNPPLSIENSVMKSLKEDEYECYIIRDYQCAKAILRDYQDAICFIFVDDVLTINEWFNFIKSFEYDDTLKSIFLGVISLNIKPELQQKFLMNLKLPGGCVSLNNKVEKIYETLKGILEINGAKGRRKYIRLDCDGSKYHNLKVEGYLALNGILHSFSVVNISTAGFACLSPLGMRSVFTKLQPLENVSITIGKRSIVTKSVVFDSKPAKDKLLSVLLFAADTPQTTRNHIRNYIFSQLESSMSENIESVIKDLNSYTDKDFEKWIKENVGSEEVFVPLEKVPLVGFDKWKTSAMEAEFDDASELEEIEPLDESV